MKRPYKPTDKPHPLHDVVVRIFEEKPAHDRVTLACALAGTTSLTTKGGGDGLNAYRTVAEDVLGYMTGQGHLVTDEMGWHRLAGVERQ